MALVKNEEPQAQKTYHKVLMMQIARPIASEMWVAFGSNSQAWLGLVVLKPLIDADKR